MWLRETIYTEQPLVHIRNEAIIYALNDGVTKSYSTVQSLDDTFTTNKIPGASISALSSDSDGDGKPDTFKIGITFAADSTKLQALQIYLFFDYGLRDRALVQMQDYIRFDVNSGIGIKEVDVIGNIVLNQKQAIRASATIRDVYNNSVFADPFQTVNAEYLSQNKSLKNYAIDCDCTTSISPGMTSSAPIVVNIELYVPRQQKILYVPSILENAKLSWILYLSYLIPIYWIVEHVLNFALRNKVFANQTLNNLPFEKRKTD